MFLMSISSIYHTCLLVLFLGSEKIQVMIFFKVYYITQNKVWNPCMYTIKHDSDVSIKIAEIHCNAHQQSDKPCTKLS